MSPRLHAGLVMATICAVAVGLAACSSGTSSSSSTTGTSSSPAGADAATSDAAPPPPAPEQTGQEQPQAPQGKPAVELASLPVGGGGPNQNPDCVGVSWSDPAFRDGVKIVITGVDVKGDFTEVGTSCQTPCRNYVFTSDQGTCQVQVGYAIPEQPRDLSGTVGLRGDCVAPDDATCQKVKVDAENAPGHLVQLRVSAEDLPQNPGNGGGSQEGGSQSESSSGSGG
jgi:hypothetical protein